jgi:hypothetical protein
MIHLRRILLVVLCLALSGHGYGKVTDEMPQLPTWQVLEFEEQAFWATANSRMEVLASEGDEAQWEFTVSSSVVGNSEELSMSFEPASGRALKRDRLSKGKEQRLKTFEYRTNDILRERHNPEANSKAPPGEWPVTNRQTIPYPAAASKLVVTNPHLLILLAQQLQAQGPGGSMEVLVHTDFNFYRVRLTSGNGIPVTANYKVTGDKKSGGLRDTVAVALQVSPEDGLTEKEDFSLLGLEGEIILFFDKDSGLPLQIRGTAPRIGATDINLKSVTMRPAQQ